MTHLDPLMWYGPFGNLSSCYGTIALANTLAAGERPRTEKIIHSSMSCLFI
jgi:hypothetical protein